MKFCVQQLRQAEKRYNYCLLLFHNRFCIHSRISDVSCTYVIFNLFNNYIIMLTLTDATGPQDWILDKIGYKPINII